MGEKRIKFEYGEQKFSMSKANFSQLLERFDVRNAVKKDEGWHINIKCPLCERYLRSEARCTGCTFHKYHWADIFGLYGCMSLIKDFIRNELDEPRYFDMDNVKIHWGNSKEINRMARKQLRFIHRELTKVWNDEQNS